MQGLMIAPSVYAGPAWDKYLGRRHFWEMFGLALMIHALLFCLWLLLPRDEILTVPVHVLNLKLGGNEGIVAAPEPELPMLPMAPAMPMTSPIQDQATKALEQAITPPEKPAEPVKNESPQEAAAETSVQLPKEKKKYRKYVREKEAVVGDQGSRFGNSSAADAEILARYEQLISQWIQRHKVYPDEARAEGVEGRAVARIRIDRKGNIKYFTLEKATGSPILDRAVSRMMQAANPVPPVPDNYPAGALLEFLVPINFSVER